MSLFMTREYSALTLRTPSEDQIKLWNAEIEVSVQRNFHFLKCPIVYAARSSGLDPRNLPITNSSILVNRRYPSFKIELNYLQLYPESLTLANPQAVSIARGRGYYPEKFENVTKLRWEVGADHPGQNQINCVLALQLAAEGRPVSFYQEFRSVDRAHYISYLKYGLVHPTGAVTTSCGYYQGYDGCETMFNRAEEWQIWCADAMRNSRLGSWSHVWDLTSEQHEEFVTEEETIAMRKLWGECMNFKVDHMPYRGVQGIYGSTVPQDRRPRRVNSVVVISAFADSNFYHFMADSLARLMYLLPLIRRRPNMYIHIREHELYRESRHQSVDFIESAKQMRMQIFRLLGIDPARIISGAVLAKYIIVPRHIRCAYTLSNPAEIVRLRFTLMKAGLEQVRQVAPDKYPEVVRHFLYLFHSVLPAIPPAPLMKPKRGTKQEALSQDTSSSESKNRRQLEEHGGQEPMLKRKDASKHSTAASNHNKHRNNKKTSSGSEDEFSHIYASVQQDGSILSSLPDGKVPADYAPKKVLILVQRYTKFQSCDRNWSDRTFERVKTAVRRAFPDHTIVEMSDKPSTNSSTSVAYVGSNMANWMVADVVIASHGAALANMLFLPPHALVVEITGYILDITMPVCGYYGPFTALVGVHHYIYVHSIDPPFAKEALDTSQMGEDVTNNKDFALPAEDMAQKAAAYYRWIHKHKVLISGLSSVEKSSPVVSTVADALDKIPRSSVLRTRTDVAPRVSVIDSGLILRMFNSTTGRVKTRP